MKNQKSAPGGWDKAAMKRDGATFKLYIIREELSEGQTTNIHI